MTSQILPAPETLRQQMADCDQLIKELSNGFHRHEIRRLKHERTNLRQALIFLEEARK